MFSFASHLSTSAARGFPCRVGLRYVCAAAVRLGARATCREWRCDFSCKRPAWMRRRLLGLDQFIDERDHRGCIHFSPTQCGVDNLALFVD